MFVFYSGRPPHKHTHYPAPPCVSFPARLTIVNCWRCRLVTFHCPRPAGFTENHPVMRHIFVHAPLFSILHRSPLVAFDDFRLLRSASSHPLIYSRRHFLHHSLGLHFRCIGTPPFVASLLGLLHSASVGGRIHSFIFTRTCAACLLTPPPHLRPLGHALRISFSVRFSRFRPGRLVSCAFTSPPRHCDAIHFISPFFDRPSLRSFLPIILHFAFISIPRTFAHAPALPSDPLVADVEISTARSRACVPVFLVSVIAFGLRTTSFWVSRRLHRKQHGYRSLPHAATRSVSLPATTFTRT